ncbi:unnamed protein product [Parnassius mnemosyne]|uniref:FLYWCH-type domain-containing protein n=1 Tax=Parnassius mnemosyne TaxID=213953 RepID=A0AAV1K7T5_9NEOP
MNYYITSYFCQTGTKGYIKISKTGIRFGSYTYYCRRGNRHRKRWYCKHRTITKCSALLISIGDDIVGTHDGHNH